MTSDLKPVQDYIHAIEKELVVGNATEYTHRSALKALVESLGDGVVATNEPRRIECGAPDFVVSKGSTTIGYMEAKDVGKSLDEAEKSGQLSRYRDSLSNLILTDYLQFRWYVDRDCCLSARLGTPTKEGKIKRDKTGIQAVAELLSNFLDRKGRTLSYDELTHYQKVE